MSDIAEAVLILVWGFGLLLLIDVITSIKPYDVRNYRQRGGQS